MTKRKWNLEETRNLYNLPFFELIDIAHQVHKENFNPQEVQISTLLNIKKGACPEKCNFCSQSAHFKTTANKEKYKLLDLETVLEAAQKAKDAGSDRFCMAAAWRGVHNRDVKHLKLLINEVKNLGLETCLSAGLLSKEQAIELKDAGLDFYNHNVETSEENFDNVVSTHSFQDRIDTLQNVGEAGINICSGGIIGTGETIDDRLSMFVSLKNLPNEPESIPINLLMKLEGTPYENIEDTDVFDFIRIIAVARIMFPVSYVRLSAGRITLSDEAQALCFFAGANSLFSGEILLTAANPENKSDQELFKRLNITPFYHKTKEHGINENAA